MPIRQREDVKPTKSNIGAAFDVDNDAPEEHAQPTEAVTTMPSPQAPEAVAEVKSAIIQVTTYPSWRKHFHIEAAKRGEKLAPIALQALIDRYGLPEK